MNNDQKITKFTTDKHGPVTFTQMVHRLHFDLKALKRLKDEANPNDSSTKMLALLERRISKEKEIIYDMITSPEFLAILEEIDIM